MVGLPEAVVRESKERVRAALVTSGFDFPAGRITVNLSPADLPKEGGRFDLPIAIGILAASGEIPRARARGREFYGELSLGGELRETPKLLPALIEGARCGRELILPLANALEARPGAAGKTQARRAFARRLRRPSEATVYRGSAQPGPVLARRIGDRPANGVERRNGASGADG